MTYHVEDNVTRTPASTDFSDLNAALQICHALNTENPGGRYGVYDETGTRQ